MYKTLSLPSLPFAPAVNRHSIKAARFNPVNHIRLWTSYALAALSLVMLLSYLFGVNGNAVKGYEIKKLQTQISALSEQNEKLSLKVAETSSMVSIQTDFLNSNFVAEGQAKFLQVSQFSQR